MKRSILYGGWVLLVALLMVGCGLERRPTADQKQNAQQEMITDAAVMKVGMPVIKNFTEKTLARDLYELRDQPALATYAYIKDANGGLRCFGQGIGYGLPYATQYSNPDQIINNGYSTGWAVTTAQAEPNGLYMPHSADATWYPMQGPDGKIYPVYSEERLTISPFPLPCKPMDAP
jgi:hypothetical protein